MKILAAERFLIASAAGGAASARMALEAFRATTGGCKRGWADSEISFDLLAAIVLACQSAIGGLNDKLAEEGMPLSWAGFSVEYYPNALIYKSVGDTRVICSLEGEVTITFSDGTAAGDDYYRVQAMAELETSAGRECGQREILDGPFRTREGH